MTTTCKSCGKKNRIPAKHLADAGRCGACQAAIEPAGEPLEVDTAVFDEIVRESRVPVLVDFWAAWCGPCRAAAPEVKALAHEMAGKALVLKVDTETHPDLATRFRVQSIPNFVVIQNGANRLSTTRACEPQPDAQLARNRRRGSKPITHSSASLLANMGIASTSFMGALLGKRSVQGGSSDVMSLPPVPAGRDAAAQDTLQFFERCHALGASGVQTKITGDPLQLRARAEELGMWLEAMISIRNATPETLEHEILQAKAAGCTLARDGLLGGRRYETFRTLSDWNSWKAESLRKLTEAIPIFEKHHFTLALENHKDWTLDEYSGLFKRFESEYFGACLDFGNNLSLLDDVTEPFQAVRPYLKATHCKDVAVASCAEGFLMSEVPLGEGILDLPSLLAPLANHQPHVHLSLEMITRDPLLVPCLTDPVLDHVPRTQRPLSCAHAALR